MDAELIRASEQLATAVGGAIAAKPLLERLLGPSFDYAGRSISSLLERYGNINVATIFSKAARKVSASGEGLGPVNPRVLRTVIEDGSYASDEVTAEYFAGLLASSARNGGDDRAVMLLSIVRELSTAQLRLHHLFYSFLRVKYVGTGPSLESSSTAARLFISADVLTEYDIPAASTVNEMTLAGLARCALIAPTYETQRYALLTRATDGQVGVVLTASRLGAQLFLWVHGQPDVEPEGIFDVDLALEDWERNESRKVGIAEEIDAHAAAREKVILAEKLCERTDDGKHWISPVELLTALQDLSDYGRFLSLPMYEIVRALPDDPEMLPIARLYSALSETSTYLRGVRL
jgi:hypothetical protein